MMFGSSLSTTVTVYEQVSLFPAASLTLYVTVEGPTGNIEPLVKDEIKSGSLAAQLSVARTGSKLTEFEQDPTAVKCDA